MRPATLLFPLAMLPAAALAQPPTYQIYDSRNQLIGPQIELYDLAHEYNGTWYTLNFDKTGFHAQALFYFTEPLSANCTGQKYLADNIAVPEIAVYDGSTIWAGRLTGEASLHLNSFEWGGICYYNDPTYAIDVVPAMTIDTNPHRWIAPFVAK